MMAAARRNTNRARCQFPDCDKFAQTRGLCKAHGGGSRCRDPTCNKLAQSRGLCIAHGGGRRCQHEDCTKLAQSKGYCISHGGGRRCTVPDCEKFSQVKGRCKSHSKLPLSPLTEEISEALKHQRLRALTDSPSKVSSSLLNATPRSATKLSIDFLVNPQGNANEHHHSRYMEGESDYSNDSESGSIDDVISGFQRISRISPRHEGDFRSQRPSLPPHNSYQGRDPLISFLDNKSPNTPLPSIASLRS